ncbi:hypothetical protein PIB30_020227 [Stylosanthes scabra]|uniref:Uncharacterized protein n=1 Tax=Stylosanthes scabra TaxID=79078 RepID=A0ABU6S8S4_9FABA|nr:hypothetical protein [Stylosanthes scabra]
MMLPQWKILGAINLENRNVNQSKEIVSSWDTKKPVENSSLGLLVPSGMCVSKSHKQPLSGSSSKEDAADTARHADTSTMIKYVDAKNHGWSSQGYRSKDLAILQRLGLCTPHFVKQSATS